jgi:hypothetical protein
MSLPRNTVRDDMEIPPKSLFRDVPISDPEFPSPFRLAYFASGGEFQHIWSDVHNWSAVDGVEPRDFHGENISLCGSQMMRTPLPDFPDGSR